MFVYVASLLMVQLLIFYSIIKHNFRIILYISPTQGASIAVRYVMSC